MSTRGGTKARQVHYACEWRESHIHQEEADLVRESIVHHYELAKGCVRLSESVLS